MADLDAVTADPGDRRLCTQLNDGTGRLDFSTSVDLPGLPAAVAMGDLDADGDLDVVASMYVAAGVEVLLSDGLGGLQSHVGLGRGRSLSRLVVADIDGDGDLDVVAAGGEAGPGLEPGFLVAENDGSADLTADSSIMADVTRAVAAANVAGAVTFLLASP